MIICPSPPMLITSPRNEMQISKGHEQQRRRLDKCFSQGIAVPEGPNPQGLVGLHGADLQEQQHDCPYSQRRQRCKNRQKPVHQP